MSELYLKNYKYDYNKVKEARELAKKTKNEYFEALIEGFLFENDPEYRYELYCMILDQ
ncbi:MAG: hypothetical protein ACE5KT_07030 [Methanosarcinales archaeon]